MWERKHPQRLSFWTSKPGLGVSQLLYLMLNLKHSGHYLGLLCWFSQPKLYSAITTRVTKASFYSSSFSFTTPHTKTEHTKLPFFLYNIQLNSPTDLKPQMSKSWVRKPVAYSHRSAAIKHSKNVFQRVASAITWTPLILPNKNFLLLKYSYVVPDFPIPRHLPSLPLPWLPYMKSFHLPVSFFLVF